MNKTSQIVITAVVAIFAFFAGVKLSDSIKNHASWLFEQKEEEVELPDLTNEETAAEEMQNGQQIQNNSVENMAAPAAAESQEVAPAAAPAAPAAAVAPAAKK